MSNDINSKNIGNFIMTEGNQSTEMVLDILVHNLSAISIVQSIGISGAKTPLPNAGEGDIDIFIYCDKIPEASERQTILDNMSNILEDRKVGVFEGGHWGTGDFAAISGVETWMMYFTTEETLSNIEAILNGEFPDKLGNYYYPVGRCAMLKGIDILYDRSGFLASLKKRLSVYPGKLGETLSTYHLNKLGDTEDLERAASRSDVLFYHFALDIALDHFLQALFAINKTFFPSRKRSFEHIRQFENKPEKCAERLLEVLRLGGCSERIAGSKQILDDLVRELRVIAKK